MSKFLYKNKAAASPFLTEDLSLVDLSLEQLVESDFHLGTIFNQFDKLNFLYIFANRFNVAIMNLTFSLHNLKLSVYFTSVVVARRGKVLFYDGSEHTQLFIRFIGVTSRQHFINHKWIAGLLTNFKEFYPAAFTGMSRHFRFPAIKFNGMRYIHRPPNIVCLLNIKREFAAFFESFRMGIPTIALVSSDSSIAGVTFPIFANDSSSYTYITFLSILRSAVLNGYKHEIYKFYRRSLRNTMKLRYIRYFLSRRVRFICRINQFRMLLVKIFFDHQLILYKFLNFCLCSLSFVSESVDLGVEEVSRISEFFKTVPNFKFFILEFLNVLFFPLARCFNSFFEDSASNGLIPVIDPFDKYSFKQFFEKSKSTFVSEGLFCNFFFKFLKRLGCNFFTNSFLSFFDMFLSKFVPLILFLFKNFIDFNRTLLVSEVNDFLRTVVLLSYLFETLKLEAFVKNAVEVEQISYTTSRFSHYLHKDYPYIPYKSLAFMNLKLPKFAKILTFTVSQVPPFVSFDFFSLVKMGKFFFKFKRGYGPLKCLKFSKFCKRSFRNFVRSYNFFRYLFKNVYKKPAYLTVFRDLKTTKFVSLSKHFIKFNENKRFFRSRYVNVLHTVPYKKKEILQGASENLKKFGSFLLAFFDEEFDDSRFSVNDEFFHFQVGYGSTYLTRQYLRNKRLEFLKQQLQKGYDPHAEFLRLVFKKRFRLSRIRYYFFWRKNRII